MKDYKKTRNLTNILLMMWRVVVHRTVLEPHGQTDTHTKTLKLH